MSLTRLGAVAYLNARPLVYGLELKAADFTLRFDAPSKCAALLHGQADRSRDDSVDRVPARSRPVPDRPGLGITSDGPVASVALFCRTPLSAVRTIAADISSRTSNALLRILCVERFGLDPEFVPMAPDATAMLERCDAALIIGDPALFLDPGAQEVRKIDLGEEWTAMTGLPFVWAFWAGRPGAVSRERLDELLDARNAGSRRRIALPTTIAAPERSALCRRYLRENIQVRARRA